VAEPQAEGQKQRWEIKQIFSILALDAKDHRQIAVKSPECPTSSSAIAAFISIPGHGNPQTAIANVRRQGHRRKKRTDLFPACPKDS